MTPTFDLTDPAFWNDDPLPALDWLRENDPVHRHDGPAGPFWAVTRHADVVQVNTYPHTFRSGDGVLYYDLSHEFAPYLAGDIVMMDDPEHKWLRAIVGRSFNVRSLRPQEESVAGVVASLLDAALDAGPACEFVEAIAEPLPARMIGSLLGVPLEEQHLIPYWSAAYSSTQGSDRDVVERSYAILEDARAYFDAMTEDRLANPRDDLITALAHAEVDGRRMTSHDTLGFFLTLNLAGLETTRSALAGAIVAFAGAPDQFQQLRRDPSLVPKATDEVLRWTTPVNYFRRTAASATKVGEVAIEAGDRVAMYFQAANRDPRMFDRPDEFDVARTPNPHVTFGAGGPHFCLGAALARMEIRAVLAALATRCEAIELTAPATRAASTFLSSYARVPAMLHPDRSGRR